MKVLLYKSYCKNSTVYFNYGDDYSEVYHNFNHGEKIVDVSKEDFSVFKRSIDYFNSKGNNKYTLGFIELVEENEFNSFLSDFKNYEKIEHEKAEAKRLAEKAAEEAKKHERTLKKLAKELKMTLDDVKVMLANKNKN